MSDLSIGLLAIGLMLAGIYFGMRIGIREVFISAFPFVVTMFILLPALIAFPPLSTWLARM